MAVHNIAQGEHLSSIAEQYGFQLTSTIWDHPENAQLKAERQDGHILYPGDQVFIPDKAEKKKSLPTTKVHKFKLAGEKLKLKLVLLDVNGNPRANESCTLVIDDDSAKLTTGGDGSLERQIAKTAKGGEIGLAELMIPLKVGHLDPVNKQSGQVARLNNLGYGAGDPNNPDPDRLRSAVEEFQCDQSLPVSGECDGATQDQLKSVHGC